MNNNIFFVKLYKCDNGEYIITTDDNYYPFHNTLYMNSHLSYICLSKYKYELKEFMCSIPESIKKIIFNLSKIDNCDLFSFLPQHVEKIKIEQYYIDNVKLSTPNILNNLPYGLKKIKIEKFKMMAFYSGGGFRITSAKYLPTGYKHIQLSQIIKLPFGCVLKLKSFGDHNNSLIKERSFSNVDNIIIVFVSFDDEITLPIPEPL
jgi:hypothetical protein